MKYFLEMEFVSKSLVWRDWSTRRKRREETNSRIPYLNGAKFRTTLALTWWVSKGRQYINILLCPKQGSLSKGKIQPYGCCTTRDNFLIKDRLPNWALTGNIREASCTVGWLDVNRKCSPGLSSLLSDHWLEEPECREGRRRPMVEQTRGGLCQKLRNLQIQHTDPLPEVVGIPGMKERKVKADCWLLIPVATSWLLIGWCLRLLTQGSEADMYATMLIRPSHSKILKRGEREVFRERPTATWGKCQAR